MFIFVKNLNVSNEPLVNRKLKDGVSCDKGVALVEDATTGELIIAVGTAKPTYISADSISAGAIGRVAPIRADDRFEVSGAAGTYTPGAKYTLHASNGKEITNTTTSGVFTVEEVVEGTKVIGRF